MWAVCYFLFLESGLVHLLPPLLAHHLPPSLIDWISSIPCLPWRYAVAILCLGHFFHSLPRFQLKRTLLFFFLSSLVVTFTEELSLRYGLIFGSYSFTATFGYKFTSHFPLLALGCWGCLLYPNMLLINLIFHGQPLALPARAQIPQFAFLGAVTLTLFDVISEPIHVLYGHRLWDHAAFVDPISPLDSFVSQPDWIFTPHQPHHSYYGIPLQVNLLSVASSSTKHLSFRIFRDGSSPHSLCTRYAIC
jgi:uncharacterized membrane protein